jgi:hypothetical protein
LAKPVYRELKQLGLPKTEALRLVDSILPVDPALRAKEQARKEAFRALPQLQQSITSVKAANAAQTAGMMDAVTAAMAPLMEQLARRHLKNVSSESPHTPGVRSRES